MSSYAENREWSDKYIPAVCKIVGQYLLTPSDFKKDATQATDLIVLDARDMRIAVRTRDKAKYREKFGYEFTLRSRVKSGSATELEKVVNGLGDWLFYGFVDEHPEEITDWWLIDLSAFRAALIRRDHHKLSIIKKSNGDGTEFYAFDLRSFPANPPILVAASHELPQSVIAA
jgi:hypothetical protein